MESAPISPEARAVAMRDYIRYDALALVLANASERVFEPCSSLEELSGDCVVHFQDGALPRAQQVVFGQLNDAVAGSEEYLHATTASLTLAAEALLALSEASEVLAAEGRRLLMCAQREMARTAAGDVLDQAAA